MSDALAGAASYGTLDRLLHRLAFVHPGLQRVLGDLENDLFKKRLADVRVERPVFVAGLPRAGTTLVLELLYGTGEFASFTYRQMPFVLNPLLWDKLSARSQRSAAPRERAHGDAMMVGFDSPEAFEEVLWINHLSDVLFDGDTMRTVGPEDLTDDFRSAYRQLAAKLVCLAGERRDGTAAERRGDGDADGGGGTPLRYLSKNNANVARLPAIASVFDDATLLCCFRDPRTHVASLHAQHRRFLELHDDDAFAERYMAWIGHHDFGRNFRPIRFGGPAASERSRDPSSSSPLDPAASEPDFWWRYWIDAYRHVLDTAPPQTRFVRFEALLENGPDALARLAEQADLTRPEVLLDAASTLRAPTSKPASLAAVPPALLDEAEALYRELAARAD